MRSTYVGSMDVTYLVIVPVNRGPVRVKLFGGVQVQVLRAGTSTPMQLGQSDIAALYAACPDVRIKPLVSSRVVTRAAAVAQAALVVEANPQTPESTLAIESAEAARPETTEKKLKRRKPEVTE
ncbi:MAG TPA: hypothetical protein DCQ64_17145 [Candidatus Rokubacteria bacterium]|nr:hypothetical protein [Candidatus Rokubacteria bacterium]